MNPVLLKPERDTRRQVVVLGEARPRDLATALARAPRAALAGRARRRCTSLLDEYDVVVIEGAGSPAEINLRAGDIVNMAVALEARRRVLLCCDIDRGGAFAHLLGHLALPDAPRSATLLAGFVLNRFRGDAVAAGARARVARGADRRARRSASSRGATSRCPRRTASRSRARAATAASRSSRCPAIANLDEFAPLGEHARYVRPPGRGRRGATAIVLPGTKSTLADLAWLRTTRPRRRDHARGARPACRCSASAAGCRCSAGACAIRRASRAAARRTASGCSTS